MYVHFKGIFSFTVYDQLKARYLYFHFFFEDLIDLIERFMMGQHPIEQLEGQSDL